MLNASWTPCNENNSFQNLLVKVGSLSEITKLGMQCNLKICFKKSWATTLAVWDERVG